MQLLLQGLRFLPRTISTAATSYRYRIRDFRYFDFINRRHSE